MQSVPTVLVFHYAATTPDITHCAQLATLCPQYTFLGTPLYVLCKHEMYMTIHFSYVNVGKIDGHHLIQLT